MWDKLMFSKAQDALGGRVRGIVVAAAPISTTVVNRCRAVLGCPIISGYGLTECSGALTLSLPIDYQAENHVGPPLPICHLKLVDVEELNYFASKNEGEICAKGPCIMKGYFRDPAATAAAIDPDGWLHTGDIGTWLDNGALRIIDRKGNIIKMAQGEFVSPEKVEEAYARCDLVSNILVAGSPIQSFLVAVVSPKEPELTDFAATIGIKGFTFEELCQNSVLKNAVLQKLHTVGQERQLNNLEQIRTVHLTADVWSVEGGHVTPTLKRKRGELRKIYEKVIADLFEEGKTSPPPIVKRRKSSTSDSSGGKGKRKKEASKKKATKKKT